MKTGSTGTGRALPAYAVIMKRELGAWFSGPVAYIVIGLFLGITGFLFFSTFFLYNRSELRGFFGLLPILFAFFIPAVTMRLFSEERRGGTIETLLTMPVTGAEVVAGKFLAALLFTAAMLLPTLAYVVSVAVIGELDPGPVVGGYLGALFLGAGFSAIGVYASSVTKNQIVAFVIAFTISISLTLLDQFLILLPAGLVNVLEYLSAGYHFESVSRGIIDSRDLVYFVSLCALFLLRATTVIEERREV